MKNKQKIITLLAVLAFLLMTAGVTYAFFSYIGSGSTENTISSDSITFLYEEINQQGNGISIENATPVSDTVGRQGQAFNFRIISTATNTISIPYEIDVRKKDGSDNLDSIVKLSLSKVDGNNQETEVQLSKYSDLTTVTKNNHQEKQLHMDKVPANTNGYSQQYRLRMWIDENADFSTGNYNEKTFSVTVNVYSTGHVETDADRQAASRTDVTSLSVNNTTLTGNNNLYVAELPPETTETTINLVTTNPYTQAVIEKTDSTYTNVIAMNTGIQRLSTSKKVSLSDGDNYFRIRLTSEDGTTNSELHLKITVVNYTLYTQDFGENGRTLAQNNTLSVSFTNNTSSTSRTYELVAELPSGTTGKVLMSYGGSNTAGGVITLSTNNFSGYANGSVFGADNNVTLSTGKHHYAIVTTTASTKLYEDGVLKFTGPAGNNAMRTSTRYILGSNQSWASQDWSGGTIYSYAVIQDELAPGSFILGN